MQKAVKLVTPPLFILVLMVSVGPFGDTEYTPSLPRIAHELGVTYSQTQLTMTIYLFGYAISQLFYGPFSDRFGRKPVMLVGAASFVVGSLICYTSYSLTQLLIGRFVQSIGACAGSVISSAAVRDAFPEEERGKVFAKVNAAFAIAPGLGPIAGSVIDHWFGWHANFLTLLILSLIMLISVFLFFPETNHHRSVDAIKPKQFFGNYIQLFHDPYYLAYLLVLGLAIGVVYCSLVEAPALIIGLMHLSSVWFTVIAGGVVFGFIVGSIVAALLNKVISADWIILLGLITILLGALGQWAFVWFDTVVLSTTLIPIMVIFCGVAMIVPMAMAESLAPFEHVTGSASAMMGCFEMGIASLATGGMSIFHDGTANAMPFMFTILSVTGIVVFVLLVMSRPGHDRYVV